MCCYHQQEVGAEPARSLHGSFELGMQCLGLVSSLCHRELCEGATPAVRGPISSHVLDEVLRAPLFADDSDQLRQHAWVSGREATKFTLKSALVAISCPSVLVEGLLQAKETPATDA